MFRYIFRRLIQSSLTIFGVMLITFLLFNVIAGDVAGQYLGPKAKKTQKQAFLEKHDLNLPAGKAFAVHLKKCITFSGKSFETEQTVGEIIAGKAKYSLAITIPSMAIGWLLAMITSCFVAYYRGTWIDRGTVFMSVLGMCIPFLAYMIVGQWAIFKTVPEMGYGLRYTGNIYIPVGISVIAGLGMNVRFYRTVILNEIHQDYVRTARAKGAPLPDILFKHVLKNSMLPILTNLVLAIPFLILGSLLLEKFFGIPGLGDLMVTSITKRDLPIINGLTFLTAIIYVIGLLITDILYAIFDPRIRLK